MPPGRLLPANGVYATWVILDDEPSVRLAGVTNVGVRPSFDNGHRTVETHLLDFEGDLYGQTIEVAMLQKIRDDQQFANLDAMIERLAVDEVHARAVLAEVGDDAGFPTAKAVS